MKGKKPILVLIIALIAIVALIGSIVFAFFTGQEEKPVLELNKGSSPLFICNKGNG